MKHSLMQEIFNFIIDNSKEFQLNRAVTEQFRPYIFDSDGEYLKHGGKQVSDFIDEAIRLIGGPSRSEVSPQDPDGKS